MATETVFIRTVAHMKKVLLFSLLISGLSFAHHTEIKMPELEKMNENIQFDDDLDFENILLAIQRQEAYFNRVSLDVEFQFGKKNIKRKKLRDSLAVFKGEVISTMACLKKLTRSECYKTLNENLNRQFDVYRPVPLEWERGHKDKKTLFTAYYSPDLNGSKVKTAEYKNPIYAMPKDEKLRRSTSDEINFGGALKGKGLELFYVKESLYDVWLLHVQGGGRVKVKNKDGTITKHYLSYAGSNNQKFTMLFRYMLDQGMLTSGNAGVPNQRAYFNDNPQDQRAILASSPSFIYFKVTEDEPLGVKNIPLTEKRSLATDYRRVQEYGIINYIRTEKPVLSGGHRQMQKFSRFFLNQDTGGAIKGNARVDLYFGYGEEAEMSAYSIHQLGEQYYLLLK